MLDELCTRAKQNGCAVLYVPSVGWVEVELPTFEPVTEDEAGVANSLRRWGVEA